MSIIIQVPLLDCKRCKRVFAPKIDVNTQCVIIPKRCTDRECRSPTWNIPDEELVMIKEKQKENLSKSPNLLGDHTSKELIKMTKLPVLDKYKPKRKVEKLIVVCKICELFFADKDGLKRHQSRRHNGLCFECHSSNVLIKTVEGQNLCEKCKEKRGKKK